MLNSITIFLDIHVQKLGLGTASQNQPLKPEKLLSFIGDFGHTPCPSCTKYDCFAPKTVGVLLIVHFTKVLVV